jgi:pimeloyl-ACP methyl ester carboxylesterase
VALSSKQQLWKSVILDGSQIEFLDFGSGEAIVFIHGAMTEECTAVLNEPNLTTPYRLVHYHRRGYGHSTPSDKTLTIAEQAMDCLALLRRIGVVRAHFVGQSYGGTIVLQSAVTAPEIVHSVVLLEPALPSIFAAFSEFMNAVTEAIRLHQAGNSLAAIETFARAVVGDDVPPNVIESFRHRYFDSWVADADAVIRDIPALADWRFDRELAAGITQPVLNVAGSYTPPVFRRIHSTVEEWFPQAESVVVPGVSHPLLQMASAEVADRIAGFCRNHPIQKGGITRPA